MTAIGRWTARSAVLAGLVAAFAFGGTAPVRAQGSGSATLDAAVKRGHVLCAVSGQVPGFSLADSQGVMRGLDADTCRAIAAASRRVVPLKAMCSRKWAQPFSSARSSRVPAWT